MRNSLDPPPEDIARAIVVVARKWGSTSEVCLNVKAINVIKFSDRSFSEGSQFTT